MGILNKIEDLIFSSKTFASVEILKHRMVIVKMRCEIGYLSEHECHLLGTHDVRYKIMGHNLQVKEFGDTYVKIEGAAITGFLIERGNNG
ncbi:MAG: hypothetical protein FWG67_06215 [Defluviitaleaceae bacterium]|nr:hypothetical protein [Defluviitaleaceae bacterium]